jgi:alpha-L-arabinofuranosidase
MLEIPSVPQTERVESELLTIYMRIETDAELRQHSCVGAFAILALSLVSSVQATTLPVLRINTDKVVSQVSPLHAGLMTEEINHAYDGGLYGELISNRAFKDPMAFPYWPPPHWSLISGGKGAGAIAIDYTAPLNDVLTRSLRLSATVASAGSRVGAANDGFGGIPIRAATHYHLSLYAKVDPQSIDVLTLSLEKSSDSATTYAHADIRLVPGPWRHYEVDLVTRSDISATADARLVISTIHQGNVQLNLVSLFPPTWNGRPNGNRIDLMQKLADLHPKSLRFPGGDFLMGETVATRFNWKTTIAPLTDRPSHHSPFEYQATDGMGLLEFLEWCEDLHMQPILGVYAGLSYWDPAVHSGADLQPFVQDALDEIQYITGSADTPWGAQRIKDGHPAPFKLTYV